MASSDYLISNSKPSPRLPCLQVQLHPLPPTDCMSLRTVCCGPAARHFTQTIGPTSGSVSGTPLKHTRHHARLPFLRTIHITAVPRSTHARFIIPRHNGKRYKLLCRSVDLVVLMPWPSLNHRSFTTRYTAMSRQRVSVQFS